MGVIHTTERPPWLRLRDARLAGSRVTPGALLSAFRVRRPPVDVEWMCEELGIIVEFEEDLPYSGESFIDLGNGFEEPIAVMTINLSERETRQRFTIAHELAHILLHPEGRIWRTEWAADYEDRQREREADQFAAHLLMPENMVTTLAPHFRYDARKLARVFDVSLTAMEIRLDSLFYRA